MADTPSLTQDSARVAYFVFHFSGGVVGGDNKRGPVPASKASIEAMPRVKVEESGNDCSICLEEFEVDEEAREMPCKHVFHSGCVEKWLRIRGSCPVCRFLMPAEEAESRDGGGSGGHGTDGGLGSSEVREIGLGFAESVLAVNRLANLISMAGAVRGSEQSGAVQVNDNYSSSQDMHSEL